MVHDDPTKWEKGIGLINPRRNGIIACGKYKDNITNNKEMETLRKFIHNMSGHKCNDTYILNMTLSPIDEFILNSVESGKCIYCDMAIELPRKMHEELFQGKNIYNNTNVYYPDFIICNPYEWKYNDAGYFFKANEAIRHISINYHWDTMHNILPDDWNEKWYDNVANLEYRHDLYMERKIYRQLPQDENVTIENCHLGKNLIKCLKCGWGIEYNNNNKYGSELYNIITGEVEHMKKIHRRVCGTEKSNSIIWRICEIIDRTNKNTRD